MRLMMSQDTKDSTATLPTVSMDTAQRKFITKKRVISAVVAVLVTVVVVIGILVGIWIFTEQSKMVLQYKIDLINKDNQKATQDVSTNTAENIVQYHLEKDNREWWIINDYNRDLQITKVTEENGKSYCYLSSVDLSKETKPSSVKDSISDTVKAEECLNQAELRTVASSPVTDTSFIGKTASKLCADTAVYWTYPSCNANNATSTDAQRSRDKRSVCTPCGCGRRYCVTCGSVSWYYYYSGGYMYCSVYWNAYCGYAYYYYC